MGQQVGGAIPNAGDLFGEHRAVKPALGFGLDGSDQPPELLRKRHKFAFNEHARRLLVLRGLTHGHESDLWDFVARIRIPPA
jgi:hypothetical protein